MSPGDRGVYGGIPFYTHVVVHTQICFKCFVPIGMLPFARTADAVRTCGTYGILLIFGLD